MELLIFFILLFLGYVFGRSAEFRHFQSIKRREKNLVVFPVNNTKLVPNTDSVSRAFLVSGNVVISVDYFKRILAGLRLLFGGRVSSYETLLDRGRREALLRMKEYAIEQGANCVYNVRIETASISKSHDNNNVGAIEIIAYGTAVVIA